MNYFDLKNMKLYKKKKNRKSFGANQIKPIKYNYRNLFSNNLFLKNISNFD